MSFAPPPKQKFLPLREITLHSRPLVKRALTLSCDGELAVAADDSVHVFVPEFPDLARRRQSSHDESNNNDDDDEDEDDGPGGGSVNNPRAQYSEGSKHMPVSYPPLDPRINRELFLAAGERFPYDEVKSAGDDDGGGDAEDDDTDGEYRGGGRRRGRSRKGATIARDPRSDNDDDDDDDDDDSDADDGDNPEVVGGRRHIPNRPFGAGYGPITGVGSSMNHVVHMAWSPSGLGMNRRPVLAILTGSGTLAIYGDGDTVGNILPRANEGMLQHRELNSWIVLWGVGERLLVPGQQTEVAENVRGFAWAKEIGPGQALLATVNDLMEVAIISVQTVYAADAKAKGGKLAAMMGNGEGLVWFVREIARFKGKGPHPKGDVNDPDWVPWGTSFGLNWTPWLRTDDSLSSVVSYVDRNYIGFRKVAIKTPWVRGDVPKIEIDKRDIFGKCLHLSTDAFVEFENAIWTQDTIKKCRGVVVTGFHAIPFEIALMGGTSYSHEPHDPKECGTVYAPEDSKASQNPITDLVIHAPDPENPTPSPVFTLIRASATVINDDWYESTTELPDMVTDGGRTEDKDFRPQWARDIQQKIDISVPANMQLRHGYEGDSDSEEEEPDSDEEMADDAYEEDDIDPDQSGEPVPEINPHRFRLHGLTVSPGGGVTAMLASLHSTQHPERGGWHTVRSTIMFGYQPRRPRQALDYQLPPSPSSSIEVKVPQLTTEAKLFEWLYGGGPPVPAVNAPSAKANNKPDTTNNASDQVRLRALFKPAIDEQKCDLCGTKMTENKRGALSGCEKGHYFGTCATSGLAVQMPGITRSCGACGLRTIRTEILVGKMPPEKREEVIKTVGEGVCGRCGGKFLS